MIKTAKMYLKKHGKISIPFLQAKLNLSYEGAKTLYEQVTKKNINKNP